MPDFLPLPPRPAKPRDRGLTHVIDTGLAAADVDAFLSLASPFVDLVRLGFGTAYVTPALEAKLAVYARHGVPVMVGGTLTELAWLHGQVDELADWVAGLGIEHIEVSSGVVPVPETEKVALVERLADRFTVYAEVGEKDPDAILAPYRWVELIRGALEAGAALVVCEGRASGDAGVYRRDGEARTGLIDEIVHEIDPARLVFEAPRRHQQTWLIRRLGGEVNLGNVRPEDALALETLRLGLRADTLDVFHPG
ncbi:MAG: phosphosulfolactate synthase [Solirubrobacterales bacterium]|nr:phosphosulfolactate synthase [Solirubrobacterales bacterium]